MISLAGRGIIYVSCVSFGMYGGGVKTSPTKSYGKTLISFSLCVKRIQILHKIQSGVK